MNITITNKQIEVGDVEVGGVVRSSLFFIGDAEVITCSTVFDTPEDSLIFSPAIPLLPVDR